MRKYPFALIVILLAATTAAAQDKKIYQEPLWYASIGASALDITTSALIIDGKKISEANPLLRDENGRVHWPRALAYTAFAHIMEWRTYKRSRKWGLFVMAVNVIVRGGIGGARNIVLYYKHVY